MKVNITEGPGFVMTEVRTTRAELLALQAGAMVISWGPGAYTEQKWMIDICIATRKPVAIIATADDMPPQDMLDKLNVLGDVIVYEDNLEAKEAAAREALRRCNENAGRLPDWYYVP